MTHRQFSLRTEDRTCVTLITDRAEDLVRSSGMSDGICLVYCPHTTAGVTVNEAADPSVAADLLMELNRRIPLNDGYSHGEGNSAAHIKATLVGSNVTIPVVNGRLAFGTWQGIYFCEFDGPRNRTFTVSLIPSP